VTDEPCTPLLTQLNLVVRDVPRAIAFYRQLGLAMEAATHPDWAQHHAAVILANGMRLELDSVAFAQQWNPAWNGAGGGGMGVLFFSVPTREEVDRIFARLTAAGYPAQTPPQDAFWGARYAILADPDGNAVGVMSPIEPAQQRPPPAPPG
jgi:uncharacterized glyoxalase superfamily protein PhnB